MRKIGVLRGKEYVQFIKKTPFLVSLGNDSELLMLNTENEERNSRRINGKVECVTGESGGIVYRVGGRYYNYS